MNLLILAYFLISSLWAKDQIFLAAPKATDTYYKPHYQKILSFQKRLGEEILKYDDLRILVDEKAYQYFSKFFSDEVLIKFQPEDIWLRDPLPIKFDDRYIQFRYAASAQGGSQSEADYVQKSFDPLLKKLNLKRVKSKYILDGGNIILSKNKIIVSDRFLSDNNLSYSQGKKILKEVSGKHDVAIVPNDDPKGLAHIDGMMTFLDDRTLIINKYERTHRKLVLDELKRSFPKTKIVEVPTKFDRKVWDERFSSSCGINLNILRGEKTLYVPIFNSPIDKMVITQIKKTSSLKVVEIDASDVCHMGGSVRCLSWNLDR